MTQLPNWLTRSAASFPDKLAVLCGATDWTFAELAQQASALAADLAEMGVKQGDRVALLAQNGLPFVATVHALTQLGAVLVPLNTRLTLKELCWQATDARATLLLHDDHWAALAGQIHAAVPELALGALTITGAARVRGSVSLPGHERDGEGNRREGEGNGRDGEANGRDESRPYSDGDERGAPFIDLDAPQAIIYTSGTTGQPKGAIITYGMQWWNAVGSALNLGHDPADRWLACLPFFHIGGLAMLWRSVIGGVGVVVHEHFDAAAVNHSIQKDGVTIISVVAVMAQRLLDNLGAARYPAAFRCMLLGGGPAPLPLLEACAAHAIPIVQTYGMTESCSQAVTLAPAAALRKLGSAGQPLAPVQLRIMQGNMLAPTGEAGEIQLRGPTITPGYAERPDATAIAFDAEGWFATGDLGYLDAEGYLYVLDRRNDLIISGGENVYPAEIEAALLAHPAVSEAGVCGQADPQWGQVPIAFVHLREANATTIEELQTFLAERLARYKLPHTIHLVGPLPRNGAGKLLRRELPGMV
jgi:O-succinylbenzoic acid--CoA ligase